MGPEEANGVYELLSRLLAEGNLKWLVEQVNREIAFGKPAVRKPGKEERRQSKDVFAATEEYTSQERLLMLLEAMEQVVIETSEMVKVFFEIVDGPHQARVTFISESPERFEHSFGKTESEHRVESRAKLKMLIDELREEINR